jgi:hypothetical protein
VCKGGAKSAVVKGEVLTTWLYGIWRAVLVHLHAPTTQDKKSGKAGVTLDGH